MTSPSEEDPLHLTLPDNHSAGHFVPGGRFDMSDLRDGRNGPNGYSGRPGLSSQVLNPAFLEKLSRLRRQSLYQGKWALGHLWKALDNHEAGRDGERIDDVRQVVGEPWKAFRAYLNTTARARFASLVYDHCQAALQQAIEEGGLDLNLPRNPFKRSSPLARRREEGSPYDPATEAKIVETLKSRRHATIDRIRHANALADTGDAPADTLARSKGAENTEFDALWTPANAARFVREDAMRDLSAKRPFEKQYGLRRGEILRRMIEAVNPAGNSSCTLDAAEPGALYSPFLPTIEDFVSWPVELIHLGGLNEQPSFDFDRFDWYERIGPDRVIMYTRKTRKGDKPIEFSSGMGEDTPWGIVSSAIRLSEPLHDWVCRELDRLQPIPSSEITGSVQGHINRLRSLQTRVWLVLSRHPLGVTALTSSYSHLWREMNKILAETGLVEGGEPLKWSGRRARDGFAYREWLASDWFLPSVAEALHQDSTQHTANYLKHHLGRENDAASLMHILNTMRSDLAHLAKHGSRPGPEELPATSWSVPSVITFGPAREWLRSDAPDEIVRLFGIPIESEIER